MVDNDPTIDLNAVTEAYVSAALWATPIDDDGLQILCDSGAGVAEGAAADWGLDRFGFTIADLDSTTRETVDEAVRSFLATAPRDALCFWAENHGDEAIGHDLFLTSAGHGAGFWDRWSGDSWGARYGRELTDHARPYGELCLYVGTDGRIHGS